MQYQVFMVQDTTPSKMQHVWCETFILASPTSLGFAPGLKKFDMSQPKLLFCSCCVVLLFGHALSCYRFAILWQSQEL